MYVPSLLYDPRVSQAPALLIALIALAAWSASTVAALQGALPLPMAFAVNVACAYLAWTPMHEAAHGNITRAAGRRVQALVGWSTAALLYAPFASLRKLHLQHHAHLNDRRLDPDAWVHGSSAASVVLRCLTILPRYYAAFFLARTGERSPLATTLACQLAFAAALAGAAWAGVLGTLLIVWPLAALIAAALLAFALDWLPHSRDDRAGGFRDARVILARGLPLVTMGHSYHLVHHAWPDVPFHRYGRVFRERRAELEAAGARIHGRTK